MPEPGFPSKMFSGVRFALVGFNPIDGNTLRSKLLSGGGIDVGQYNQTCTHLIVDKLVYDDPICVAARSSGKVVVTGSWVDHSFDIGMLIDANSVLYRPLRDLNGIPGSESLVVCLTGYQRQDREDIMTMVDLMGGQFLKPLVANHVTHLICYKFEGEKYELAKRMKKIKLVNHRWLEDCLKSWKLLPEVDYEISGYELEMTEALAKDSEDEAEDASARRANNSPLGLRVGAVAAVDMSKSGGKDVSVVQAQDGPSFCNTYKDDWLTPKRMDRPLKAMVSTEAVAAQEHDSGCQRASTFQETCSYAPSIPVNKTDDSTSINRSIRRHSSLATYSRKTIQRSPETTTLGKVSTGQSSIDDMGLKASTAFNNSASKSGSSVERTTLFEDLGKIDKLHGEESPLMLPQAKFRDGSVSSKGSQKVQHNSEASIPPLASLLMQELRPGSPKENLRPVLSMNGPSEIAKLLSSNVVPMEDAISTAENIISNCARDEIPERSSTEPMVGNILLQEPRSGSPKHNLRVVRNISDHTEGREVAHKLDASDSATRLFNSSVVPTDADILTRENITLKAALDEVPERSVTEPVIRRSSTSPGPGLIGMKDQLEAELPKKKTPPRKSLGLRGKKKDPINQKGSIYLREHSSKDERTDCSLTTLEPELNDVPTKDPSDGALHLEVDKNKSKRKREASVGKNSLQSGKKESSSTAQVGKASVKKVKKPRKEDEAKENDTAEEKEDLALENKSGKVSSGGDQSPVAGETLTRKEPTAKDPSVAAVQLQVETNEGKRRNEVTVENNRLQSGKKRSSSTVEVGKSSLLKTKKSKKERGTKATDAVMKDIGDNTGEVGSGGDQSPVSGKPVARKEAAKSVKTGTKADKESKQLSRKVLQDEPKVFIVSGLRSQRNEYQQIIRRLKGKCCRDSHQWSYQATHFIASEIRRTEKFFAAAASGSWILKTDYVADSKEAGKLLPEEPYEWHSTGLSGDGAINLESPRKWRLVWEQTGHGALYGLRIVIYGDCTIPSLDTLKRAVKAGDGTILATAPPYTRFLNQNTDFALISPGMPRDDFWIQEFIRLEIPCVLSDYIVEYVCKPGYPLDKHVLYNTNSWAERSFNKLQLNANVYH